MRLILSVLFVIAFIQGRCQESLPYAEIPDYGEKYTAGTVAARVVDGLGFRYYWATEGLRPIDLMFRPSADARTSEETLQHIHEMSYNLVNATKMIPSEGSKINSEIPFDQLRKETLLNIREASNILKANGDKGLEAFDLIFKGEDYEVKYPFWNLLNGPISDCLWHVGQVISFRRSSGNPFNSNMSVLSGKAKK